ncbi:MAG: hypothetical protein CL777_05750 [Chloroflexi bacterium]|nr:hypothetical protein [Chloroflexota bacterium]|tara:strand:+ start:1438 stop:2547 length:1110 start_codon:yes stop_codon:yes gene_type:complete
MAEIIDADTHIIEHPGVWEYFSEKNYHRRPQLASVEATEAGGIRDFVWLINGNAVPKKHGKGSYAVAVGGSDSENNRTDIRNEVRYITDPKARVEDMDKRGVDKEIVFPTVLLAYITDDVELEIEICKSYNTYMANAWREAGDRMRWVVVPPLRNIEESIKQIEYAHDNGAVSVFFRGVEGDRSLAESYFAPVYETANRLNMAISIHTGGGSPGMLQVFDRSFSHNLPHVRSLPLFAFRDLVAHKIPEKYPNLRFGFIEASASWVPYVIHHMKRSVKGATLGANPDAALEYGPQLFKDYRLYIASETDEDIPYLLNYIGEDNIIMGSDYGHQDQSKDNGMVAVMRNRNDIEPHVIEKILTSNPAKYYGI